MALRVLLADESSTIKKVFQLALQDFAVEVCPVTLGTDVTEAARKFKPDVIFCDILLQKKNGYDVAAELKADPGLKTIPVILMWSGFMELDHDKMTAARADAQLEKPFDVQDLRQLIQQWVPKTKSQRLSSFLSFPKMPEMLEIPAKSKPSVAPLKPPPPPVPSDLRKEAWSMDSFDPIPEVSPPPLAPEESESFAEVPLPPPPVKATEANLDVEEEESWSHRPLGTSGRSKEAHFEVEDELPVVLDEDAALLDESELEVDRDGAQALKLDEPELNLDLEPETPRAPSRGGPSAAALQNSMTPQQIEKLVREMARPLIEEAIWKVVPELAERMIDRELKRLLSEAEP